MKDDSKAAQSPTTNKLNAKKSKIAAERLSDIGVIDGAKEKEDKDHCDSFEKYYNKDLDLDEGKHNLNITPGSSLNNHFASD